MTARFFSNQGNTRGHRPRLQEMGRRTGSPRRHPYIYGASAVTASTGPALALSYSKKDFNLRNWLSSPTQMSQARPTVARKGTVKATSVAARREPRLSDSAETFRNDR